MLAERYALCSFAITLSNCIKYKTIDFYSFSILEMIFMGLWWDLTRTLRILLKDVNLLKWNSIFEKNNLVKFLRIFLMWFVHFLLTFGIIVSLWKMTKVHKFFFSLRLNQQSSIYAIFIGLFLHFISIANFHTIN